MGDRTKRKEDREKKVNKGQQRDRIDVKENELISCKRERENER